MRRYRRGIMSPRTKKLIGAIVMLVWIPVYALIAALFAIKILPHASGFAAFLYYAIAGTLWTLPIAAMMPWMNREPKTK
jgi:hypothetical protein